MQYLSVIATLSLLLLVRHGITFEELRIPQSVITVMIPVSLRAPPVDLAPWETPPVIVDLDIPTDHADDTPPALLIDGNAASNECYADHMAASDSPRKNL